MPPNTQRYEVTLAYDTRRGRCAVTNRRFTQKPHRHTPEYFTSSLVGYEVTEAYTPRLSPLVSTAMR